MVGGQGRRVRSARTSSIRSEMTKVVAACPREWLAMRSASSTSAESAQASRSMTKRRLAGAPHGGLRSVVPPDGGRRGPSEQPLVGEQ